MNYKIILKNIVLIFVVSLNINLAAMDKPITTEELAYKLIKNYNNNETNKEIFKLLKELDISIDKLGEIFNFMDKNEKSTEIKNEDINAIMVKYEKYLSSINTDKTSTNSDNEDSDDSNDEESSNNRDKVARENNFNYLTQQAGYWMGYEEQEGSSCCKCCDEGSCYENCGECCDDCGECCENCCLGSFACGLIGCYCGTCCCCCNCCGTCKDPRENW
ncbi:hypothetical protein KJ644_01290 [Candidatus Dependentiae bacterium]|nr:hypothetical protein [Candidatus Dependentiae bacterium]MBU4387085.1 hypothetical protein [Candidatus Dependentiae bacterium]MCG2756236.1 hypothetical protein [Candidatus Dependentiae bacterium]